MARDGGGGWVEGGDRSREIEWKACVQMQGLVREEHLDVFGVSKGTWSCGSTSCHAGGARGCNAGGSNATWERRGETKQGREGGGKAGE
jgi:hypothetical protein